MLAPANRERRIYWRRGNRSDRMQGMGIAANGDHVLPAAKERAARWMGII